MLRAVREGKTKADCAASAEVNFPEMLDALGSFEIQESIRQANPEGRHCELLKRNPSACQLCPHNPYNGDQGRDAELYRAMEDSGDWLGDAQYLYERQLLGLGPGASMLPEEFEVLRLMREHESAIAARVQGKEIAAVIANLLTQLFKKE